MKVNKYVLRISIFFAAMMAFIALFAASARAQETGTLNIVHGIPGVEVDVCASGGVLGTEYVKIIENFNFTEVKTFDLPEGSYDAAVVLAGDACDQPVLSADDLFLPAGANASVVANLEEGGSLELSVFLNDLSDVQPGNAVVSVQHTADAPKIDVWTGRNNKNLVRTFTDFANGDQETAPVKPGRLSVALSLPGADDVIFGPTKLVLKSNTYYAVYAVGEFPTTFTYIVLPISN